MAGERTISSRSILHLRVTPLRRYAFFMSIDGLLVTVAIILAFFLRFSGPVPATYSAVIPVIVTLLIFSTLIFLYSFRVYESSWRYFDFPDIIRLSLGIGAATTLSFLIVHVFHSSVFASVPRSVVLIQAPLAFLGISAFRLSKRGWHLAMVEREDDATGRYPTLIVGAGDAGHQIAKSIREEGIDSTYEIVGFVDDDEATHGTRIHGMSVLGSVTELGYYIESQDVEVVIIAIAEADKMLIREIDQRARDAGAHTVRIVPPVSEILGDEVTFAQTEEVSVEDLLGRDPVEIDHSRVQEQLREKRVLVTGAAGTIGSELSRQIARFGPAELVMLDIDESRLHETIRDIGDRFDVANLTPALVDIRDREVLDTVFENHNIDIVFHAAAYKHVPMLQEWPIAALETNVLGTYNVVNTAEQAGCDKFVLISTDKAVNPTNNMGASKQLAEQLVLDEGFTGNTMSCSAVRFGNVLGSRGSVIPIFERQIEQGGPLTVTHPDVERYFITTSEAVSLVLEAASLGDDGDLFILDMGDPVKIIDLAEQLIRLRGLNPEKDIAIEITGLRGGEKLSEELLGQYEFTSPTEHPSIQRVSNHSSDHVVDIDDISRTIESQNVIRATQLLSPDKTTRSTTIPSNSV